MTTKFRFFILFLLCFQGFLIAQNRSKWIIGTDVSIGLQGRITDFTPTHVLDTAFNFQNGDLRPLFFKYNISASRDLTTFLRLRGQLHYYSFGGNHNRKVLPTNLADTLIHLESLKGYSYTNYGMSLFIDFDLLYKKRNENFILFFGYAFSRFKRINTFNEKYYPNGEPLSNIRYTRKGWVSRFTVGLLWEDLITESWGYSIGLNVSPRFYFSPSSLLIDKLVEGGKEQANEFYQQGDLVLNNPYNEVLQHLSMEFSLGIVYRMKN